MLLVGPLNFVAFMVHLLANKTSAFPAGGRLVNGLYLVTDHGHDIPFTPAAFWFSYIHGVIFVLVHIICMFLGWWFGKRAGAAKTLGPGDPERTKVL